MKKLLSAFIASALALSSAALPCFGSTAAGLVGDVDGNGEISPLDASQTLAYYSALSTGDITALPDDVMSAADLDRNGTISPNDASYNLAYYSYLMTLSTADTPMDALTFVETEKSKADEPELPVIDIGEPGTIKYLINTTALTPRDGIPLYNIKGDNKYNGTPYKVRTYTVTAADKAIIDKFAEENFTPEMSNYDKIEYTWRWLHSNVTYADGSQGWNTYNEILYDSFASACFEKKLGQCIQYNGALAEMLAYMGYDVYLLEMWNSNNFTNQHFRAEVLIEGTYYSIEVGNTKDGDYRMWLFNEDLALYHGGALDS